MSTLELLKSMREKIATGWTQGCSARNREGFPVVPYSEYACQWCLTGAMTADKTIVESVANGRFRSSAYKIICQLLADRNEPPNPERYNDAENRTREEVLEVLDEAINVAEIGGYE